MYNKTKRAFSLIATLIGFVLAIGVIVAVFSGIMGLIGEESEFAILDSLNSVLLDKEIIKEAISIGTAYKWLLLLVIFLLTYVYILFLFSLLKVPMKLNDKFKKIGWRKFFFILLTLFSAIIIALTFFKANIVKKEYTMALIVIGVGVIACLLQLISMFIRSIKKTKVVSEVIDDEQIVEDVAVETVPETLSANEIAPVAPVVPQVSTRRHVINSINSVNHIAVMKSLQVDPIADGLEQRLREIKHLREAGLISDSQTKSAIEKILYGFSR